LSCRRLVASLLDECLLDAVTNLGVHRTPRRLCGRLNAGAQLVIKADIEPALVAADRQDAWSTYPVPWWHLGYDRIG